LEEYATQEEFTVLRVPSAAASFAAILERRRFGIAMAEMIKIMVTTMSNSRSENPFWFLLVVIPLPQLEPIS